MALRFFNTAPEQLYERMRSGQSTFLLDVRSPAEYAAAHIPGALSLPLDTLDAKTLAERLGDPGAGTDEPLFLTCQAGLRAERAAEKLRDAGYTNLVLLEGGTHAWDRRALPMQRGRNGISLERQAQVTIGSLLILKVVFGFAVSELFFVGGALIGAGLIVAGMTHWCGMVQLLARMPWNRGAPLAEATKA